MIFISFSIYFSFLLFIKVTITFGSTEILLIKTLSVGISLDLSKKQWYNGQFSEGTDGHYSLYVVI